MTDDPNPPPFPTPAAPMETDLVRSKYTENVQAYALLGVLRVSVATTSRSYMVLVTECQSVGKVLDAEVFRITQATFLPLSAKADVELVQEVGKLLACGQFYFSHPNTALFELLSPAQIHGSGKEQKHFCWLVSFLLGEHWHFFGWHRNMTPSSAGTERCTLIWSDSASTARDGCIASCVEESRCTRCTLGTSRQRPASSRG